MTVTTTPPAESAYRPSVSERISNSWARWWFAYAMLVPVVLILAVLVFYPLLRGVWYSFTDADATNIGDVRNDPSYDFIGFRNYGAVLSGEETTATGLTFWDVLRFTVVWTGVNVFFHYTIGLGLAMLLNRPMRSRSFYRILLLIPWAMPAYITAASWRFLFNEQAGPLNAMLSIVGIDPVPWLGDNTWARISVIMVNVWLGVPFMMVALLGGLQGIPRELYEAAEVDGATKWQQFRKITLPMLRPVSSTVILLGIIWTFNMFAVIYLLTGGGPADATQILVTFSYTAAFVDPQREFALASTYGVIILSILLVFATAYQRYLRRNGEGAWG